jgi:hypothetical protein
VLLEEALTFEVSDDTAPHFDVRAATARLKQSRGL